eukprot:jgi/Picsp_1/5256/NSC_02618-R1_hypothetical protein VOLCADRAFT_89645 [Volvox carteri f. nagariensis]
MHTVPALKEWEPIVRALGSGKQTVLFRKGGLLDPKFQFSYGQGFALFPTTFHAKGRLLKRGADIVSQRVKDKTPLRSMHLEYIADISRCWKTYDSNVANVLDELHVYGPEFLETRLRWKETEPLCVLELRVCRLHEPMEIALKEEYYGCFSWVDLSLGSSIEELRRGSTPVLSDIEYHMKQERCMFLMDNCVPDAQLVVA